MRDDMEKVLVESMREGRGRAHAHKGSRRRERERLDPDGEGGRQRFGMRWNDDKHFGEHLGPLYRYLRTQVNRPWSKVYGELCAHLDRRNVVQNHLFQHIDGRVELETVWHDDEVWFRDWRGMRPIGESRAEMFVHPRTGILLPNRARVIEARRRKQERVAERVAGSAHRRSGLPGMAADCQWQCVSGLWFEVTLRPVGEAKVDDVLLKRPVCASDRELLRATYGRGDCHAVAKRQLSRKELQRHGLRSIPAQA